VDAGTTFLLGTALGAAPFVIYLTIRGALGAFFTTSFQTLPKIIDAVWSLPFPDLTSTFRSKNLNLHTLSDFLLYEHFRFILNPLVIGLAILVLLWRRKRWEWIDVALFALTAFAILTQRSALGRADFPHQYFSAFLIGPMILILLVLFARVGRLWVALLVPLLAVAFGIQAAATVGFAGSLAAPSAALIAKVGVWLVAEIAFYFVVALGVASLLGSRAQTIAILLAWRLALTPLLMSITVLGLGRDVIPGAAFERLAPQAIERSVQQGGGTGISMTVGTAVIVLVAWTAAALALGAWRTATRDA